MLQPNEIVKLIKFCKTKEDYARIKFLINSGEIAVDARLALGNNPLHVAAKCGNVKVCYYLKSKGADVNAMNTYGATPLYFAAAYGHHKVCDYLVGVGADIYLKPFAGKGPLDVAEIMGHKDVVKVLDKHINSMLEKKKRKYLNF